MADENRSPEQERQGEQQPAAAQQQAAQDPVQLLKMICTGEMELFEPIKAGEKELRTLKYDFTGLSCGELMDALDSTGAVNPSIFVITNKQALAVFAATAAKNHPEIDAHDVKSRLSGVDAVKAVQLAKLFWSASNRTGSRASSIG